MNPKLAVPASDILSLSHGVSQTISTQAFVTSESPSPCSALRSGFAEPTGMRARELILNEDTPLGVGDDLVDQPNS